MENEESKENKKITIINNNVIQKGTILGIGKANFYQGFLLTLITVFIIQQINFVSDVKIIVTVVLGVAMLLFNIIGINKRAVLSVLWSEIKFRKNRRKLHLRSPEYARKESKFSLEGSYDESIAEQMLRTVKKYINDFIEKYSKE